MAKKGEPKLERRATLSQMLQTEPTTHSFFKSEEVHQRILDFPTARGEHEKYVHIPSRERVEL